METEIERMSEIEVLKKMQYLREKGEYLSDYLSDIYQKQEVLDHMIKYKRAFYDYILKNIKKLPIMDDEGKDILETMVFEDFYIRLNLDENDKFTHGLITRTQLKRYAAWFNSLIKKLFVKSAQLNIEKIEKLPITESKGKVRVQLKTLKQWKVLSQYEDKERDDQWWIDLNIGLLEPELEYLCETEKESKPLNVDSKNEHLKKADKKKLTWVKSREKLVFFIRQLSKNGFLFEHEMIKVDNIVNNHFETNEGESFNKDGDIKRIRFVGTLSHLVFLIDQLFEHNFLSKSDSFETDNLIYNHFGDREGKPFKKGSIKATRHRIQNYNENNMVKGGEKILEIIKETENITE